jgi:hypothetical protein
MHGVRGDVGGDNSAAVTNWILVLCLRTIARGPRGVPQPDPGGKVKIEVETSYVEPKPAGPLKVVLKANGKEVASGVVPVIINDFYRGAQ